jgi:hypothetical protein
MAKFQTYLVDVGISHRESYSTQSVQMVTRCTLRNIKIIHNLRARPPYSSPAEQTIDRVFNEDFTVRPDSYSLI